MFALTYFMTSKVTVTLTAGWPSLWPQKVIVTLEVAMYHFMTPKITVNVLVGLS